MSVAAVEIFRSPLRAHCEERAFMLAAVGITSSIAMEGTDFLIQVDSGDAPQALAHLELYETERLSKPPPRPPAPKLHPYALSGSLIYALVLVLVTVAIANGFGRLDAFDAGELDAARVRLGEWWRVWTALTLHVDVAHLGANTAAGMWFGFLAGRLLGTGHAWLLVVLGAGLANWVEAQFGPVTHRAVGASTAVFTALGLLCAYSWRTRFAYPQRWALRWAPLIAGVILLGWTGSGADDPNSPAPAAQTVDVVAHALGFIVGVVLGVGAAAHCVSRLLGRVPQWLTALAAVGTIAIAWWRALSS